MSPEELLSFPCEMPIKVFGRNEGDFRDVAVAIVKAHFTALTEGDVQEKLSKEGRFVSLTISVTADSRKQLDQLYRELTANQKVLMVL